MTSQGWREIDSRPQVRAVREHLARVLLAKRRGRIPDTLAFLLEFVRGRSALDVGVVEHDADRVRLPTFKHRIVAENAAVSVGIDILDAGIEQLRQHGYNVRVCDATSDTDLGQRFERVVLGDIIEHVDNPVALLRFAARHLAAEGRILVATPNPFFVMHLLSSLRQGVFIANAEHVSWITPTMALELAHRSGLELVEYWHTQGEGKTPLRKLGVLALTAMRLRESELFSGCFYYILAKPNARGKPVME